MKNISAMMKQAQEFQDKMGVMQEGLEAAEVTGASGAGMVEITVNGKGIMRRVKIDPTLADPEDIGVLEDLILAAYNDAKGKVDDLAAEEMKKLTGGLNLPAGMKLPF